jgi:protein required for attachment to host cells
MQIPTGALVAVTDGERFNLFRNSGDEAQPKLTAVAHAAIDGDHKGSGSGHQSSSANPDGGQAGEDGFSVGAAEFLNKQVLEGKIASLIVIARRAPSGSCASTTTRP